MERQIFNIKKIAAFAGLYLLLTGILYLVGSFIAADFNISHWDGYGRFVVAVMDMCVLGLLVHGGE